jgi:hypothetical protein
VVREENQLKRTCSVLEGPRRRVSLDPIMHPADTMINRETGVRRSKSYGRRTHQSDPKSTNPDL